MPLFGSWFVPSSATLIVPLQAARADDGADAPRLSIATAKKTKSRERCRPGLATIPISTRRANDPVASRRHNGEWRRRWRNKTRIGLVTDPPSGAPLSIGRPPEVLEA